MFSNKTLIFDSIAALWTCTLLIIFCFWLPAKSFSKSNQISKTTWIAGNFTRIFFSIVTIVLIGNQLRIFNWFTVVFTYILLLLIGWFYKINWQLKKHSIEVLQNLVFWLLDAIDRGFSWQECKNTIFHLWQSCKQWIANTIIFWGINTMPGILATIALIIIISFAIFLRFENPLLEIRFAHAESYQNLLLTRQIIEGDRLQISPINNHIPVFAAIAAFLSLLGSIDAIYIVRFLSPCLGIILVFSLGYCLHSLSKNSAAALVGMFSLSTYLFTLPEKIPLEVSDYFQEIIGKINYNLNTFLIRQWSFTDLEIGIIFLLLSLGLYNDCCKNKNTYNFKSLINIVCALAIITMTAPLLLILTILGILGIIVNEKLGLNLVTIIWLLLALLAVISENAFTGNQIFLLTMPIALSLLTGIIFIGLVGVLGLILGRRSPIICLILFFAISVNFFLPLSPKIQYLEYEITARKALEIRRIFPRKTWTIVAPVEQLSQIYGAAWYEDLAVFVEKYAAKVNQPDFTFPVDTPHLFIFIEKRPFVTFSSEPIGLPYTNLSDITYQNYRSSVGRAKLQFDAFNMCEVYRRNYPNVSIYYEDENIRIYYLPGREDLPSDRLKDLR